MDKRRVRIIATGDLGGTKIVDADTGESIPKAYAVSWEQANADSLPRATIKTYFAACDIVADAEIVQDAPPQADSEWVLGGITLSPSDWMDVRSYALSVQKIREDEAKAV